WVSDEAEDPSLRDASSPHGLVPSAARYRDLQSAAEVSCLMGRRGIFSSDSALSQVRHRREARPDVCDGPPSPSRWVGIIPPSESGWERRACDNVVMSLLLSGNAAHKPLRIDETSPLSI